MIRTASKENRKSLLLLQNLPALFLDFGSIFCLSIECLSQRFVGSLLAYSQLLEIIGNLLFQRLRLGKVDDRRIDRFLQVDD